MSFHDATPPPFCSALLLFLRSPDGLWSAVWHSASQDSNQFLVLGQVQSVGGGGFSVMFVLLLFLTGLMGLRRPGQSFEIFALYYTLSKYQGR
jgi:hypothetical protein